MTSEQQATQVRELFEAGVHFGHQTQKWNPKMKPYIFSARNGIYIIDLRKTSDKLDEACAAAREFASRGKNIVFVGTKKSAVDIMKNQAQRCGMYYINRRWLGGMLTNFETIRTRINKLRELEDFINSGHIEKLPKKEVAQIMRKLSKLSKTLGGIKEMRGMPDMLFIVDQQMEDIAIKEANKLNIPVLCLADTNADPDGIDYIIPGNDDAIRSIQLFCKEISEAIIEGRESNKDEASINQDQVDTTNAAIQEESTSNAQEESKGDVE